MKAIAWIAASGIVGGFVFGLTVVVSLFEAVALVKMNEWFVMPAFGSPALGYWQAAGIALLVNMLCPHNDAGTEVDGVDAIKRLGRPLLRPWACLAFGYCFHVWAS